MSGEGTSNAQAILERADRALTTQRLHHAWILSASESQPLNELGSKLARQLLCQSSSETRPLGGCGECQACRQFDVGAHPDRFELRPDAKGVIKIDAVRALIAAIGLRPALSSRKVIEIQNVDTMNTAAQNAMLKTLEEPPADTLFVLTTTRYQGLLETIRSRVQRHHLQLKTQDHSDPFFDTLSKLNAQHYPIDLEDEAEKISEWRSRLTKIREKPDPLEAFEFAQEIGRDVDSFEQWLKILAAQLKAWLQAPNLVHTERSRLWRVHESLINFERERIYHPNRLHVSERLLLLLNRPASV